MSPPSDTFRKELQQEAQRWRDEGFISTAQFEHLSQKYEFDTLETAARDRFVMILLGLGSVLVGIGAITFVAANWQALSQTMKAGLMFVAMLSANLGGFGLMNRATDRDRWSRLGRALFLLGALLLGANLALMGQMVHSSGTRYELCVAWAIGIVVMAYTMRLSFLGILAIFILGVGYWSVFWDMDWLQNSGVGLLTLQIMPLLAGGLFLPLAYRCQSSWLFVLTAIAITSAYWVLLADLRPLLPGWMEAWLALVPFALLWAYDDTIWSRLWRWRSPTLITPTDDEVRRPFQPLARGLMLFALSVMYWLLSFQDVWLTEIDRRFPKDGLLTSGTGLIVLLLAVWTVGNWVWLGWRSPRRWSLDSLSLTILTFLGITGLLFWLALTTGPIPVLGTTVMNALLTLMCLGMVRDGLATGARPPFWWGVVMLTLQILSRVLEYETGLLIKSLVFVGCGVGVILVGLWFERYVRTLRRTV